MAAAAQCYGGLALVLLVLLLLCTDCCDAARRPVRRGRRSRATDTVGDERTGEKFEQMAADIDRVLLRSIPRLLDIDPIRSVPLHVKINVVFIGLSKTEFRLRRREVEALVPHLVHSAPHTLVPLVDGRILREDTKADSSFVEYDYNITAYKAPWEVAGSISDAVRSWLRFDHFDEQSGTAVFYSPALQVDQLIQNFLESTELAKFPCLVVLRLRVAPPRHEALAATGRSFKYGYRGGWSNDEYAIIRNHSESLCSVSFFNEKDLKKKKGSVLGVRGDGAMPPDRHRFRLLAHDWALVQSVEGPRAFEKSVAQLSKERVQAGFPVKPLTAGEDCLVDAWIGDSRAIWMDLNAGPFEWGREVGGLGVKSNEALPRGLNEVIAEPSSLATTTTTTRAAATGGVEGAGGAVEGAGGAVEDVTDSETWVEQMARFRSYYFQTCRAEVSKQLSEGGKELCTKLADIFGVYHKREARLSMVKELFLGEGGRFSLPSSSSVQEAAESWFLARVGARLQAAIAHAVTPSSPLAHSHFHARVHFRLHVVSDHSAFDPLSAEYFDIKHFEHEVSRLCLPAHQSFQFSVHRVSLSQDTELSAAYFSSLRSCIVPHVDDDDTLVTKRHLWIDSRHFEHQLTHHTSSSSAHTLAATHEGSQMIELPIFLFSINSSAYPVFVDRTYAAKALNRMVLAVQSPHRAWPSHLQCNKRQVLWDLQSPMRPLLASVALFIGGLLPTHLTFSQFSRNISQDWMWSVGNSPLALMGCGTRFSKLQVDSVHRNMIVCGVTDIAQAMNSGVAKLESIPPLSPTPAIRKMLDKLKLSHNLALLSLDSIGRKFAQLDVAGVLANLQVAEQQAAAFSEDVEALLQYFKQAGLMGRGALQRECKQNVLQPGRPWGAYACIVLILLCFVVVKLAARMLVPRRSKVKLN